MQSKTVIYDPKLRRERYLANIRGKFSVYSWNKGRMVVRDAEVSQEHIQPMYNIHFGDNVVTVTKDHEILCPDGFYREVKMLKKGDKIMYAKEKQAYILKSIIDDSQEFYEYLNKRTKDSRLNIAFYYFTISVTWLCMSVLDAAEMVVSLFNLYAKDEVEIDRITKSKPGTPYKVVTKNNYMVSGLIHKC